jgi:hypothetical protein
MFWLPTGNNLDNNEIGIGQDCAATLGVMREIFTVASYGLVSGWRILYKHARFVLLFIKFRS